MISEEIGIKLDSVTLDMLGTAKRVEITKEETTIVDGAGAKGDIEARCNQIRAQADETKHDHRQTIPAIRYSEFDETERRSPKLKQSTCHLFS